nr:methyltransferase domain-containing protein [Aneurinibacillus sp. XH2]
MAVLKKFRHIANIRFGYCDCCSMATPFIKLGYWEEFKKCLFCKSNLRYRLIAKFLKTVPNLENLTVVDLDPYSPLRPILGACKCYIRTFYSKDVPLGSINADGARCEDITNLTFEDDSIDIIISSDVLEHVDNFKAALAESERVLKPGGFHLFSVPTLAGEKNGLGVNSETTVKRAEVLDGGSIKHYLPPQYHGDPLSPETGILAFWSFGLDLPQKFSTESLKISIAIGPEGKDQRVIFKAMKN